MSSENEIREALKTHPLSKTVAERAARDPAYAEYIRQTRIKMQPLLDDLAKVGYRVEWLSELRHLQTSWEPAVPVLLHWLPVIHHRGLELDIIRCLSVPWARDLATEYLIEQFKRTATEDVQYAWVLANALSVVDVKGFEKEIIKLCRNVKYGVARQMMVYALNRLHDPEAEEAALDLLDDNDVRLHAIHALAQMKSKRALFHLERLLSDKSAYIKKAARNAITKIMR